MFVRSIGPGALRCALAFLLVLGFGPVAEAAFIVSINGNSVTDNSSSDLDTRAGFILWQTMIDGYSIELRSSTDSSRPSADLTTSQLRIHNIASPGTLTVPLLVTISESFNVPPNARGTQSMLNTLTRNVIAGLGTSGTVSSTTSGTSEGGATGTTDPTTLTSPVDSGMSFGSFDRTSEFYLLTQTIRIDGLLGDGGVTITASSFSPSPGNLEVIPVPASIVLMASGVGFLGLYGLGSYRRRVRK